MDQQNKSLNHVQHADRDVKPGDYKHLKDNELLITSIFYTLQGEGPYGGYPSTFVRLSGCNIGSKKICDFCDTKFQFHLGNILTFEAILEDIQRRSEGRSNLIVITGGEPFLQKNIIAFVEFVNGRGFEVQFETNGLLFRDIPKTGQGPADLEDPIAYSTMKNTIVCSPKMAGTTYHELRGDVFNRADCLKFVVERLGKFNYIPEYAFDFARTGRPVYVSPINVYLRDVAEGEIPNFFTPGLYNIEACRENYKYAAELCLKYGFILNIQKHLFIGQE